MSEFELAQEAESFEFHLADDVFIKTGMFHKAHTIVPQHSHEHDHNTFIASGAIHAWCDGEFLGEFRAPSTLLIKRHAKHLFETLEDRTTILCIHNISRTGMVDIHDLHELTVP